VVAERVYLTGLDGYLLVPLHPRNKTPCRKAWPKLRLTSDNLSRHHGNIGLLLGPVYPCGGGFLAVDEDDPKDLLLSLDPLRAVGVEYDALIRTGGQHRGWQFLLWLRCHAWAWKWTGDAQGLESSVEVRGRGMQSVIPPSEVEVPYRWVEPLDALAKLTERAAARPRDWEERLYHVIKGAGPPAATLPKGVYLEGVESTCCFVSSKSRDPLANTEHDLWTRPEVAWLPILRAAYQRTYQGEAVPDLSSARYSIGRGQTPMFRDPFESEETPSCCLFQLETGEWTLRSYRARDADGACFMSVQQAFHALRTGRKPLRWIPRSEQRSLTSELLTWLGISAGGSCEPNCAWWQSDSRLGRIGQAALKEIQEQESYGRCAVLDCRRLGAATCEDYRTVSHALKLLCAVGLFSRDECRDDYALRRPGRKQFRYQALFDAVHSAEARIEELGADHDKPWSWRAAVAKLESTDTSL